MSKAQELIAREAKLCESHLASMPNSGKHREDFRDACYKCLAHDLAVELGKEQERTHSCRTDEVKALRERVAELEGIQENLTKRIDTLVDTQVSP